MNQDNFEQQQPTVVSNAPLPGHLVSQAREQRGLGLRELGEKTRLTENVLRAIERDDFLAMGEPVYARGYYRKCAEALNLNADALVEAYEQHSGTASPVPIIEQRPSIAYREGPGKLALIIAIGLMLLVFAACALWLWSEERGLETVETSPLAIAAEQAAPERQQSTTAPEPSVLQQAEVQRDAESAQVIPQSTPAPAVLVAPQDPPTQNAIQAAAGTPAPKELGQGPQVGSVLLSLEVSGGEAWINIRDRDGRKLIYKLLQAGHVQEVQGQAPLRVSLGRADHVTMAVNGRSIDMSAQLKPGLTAIFLIDASGRVYNADDGTAQ